MLTLQINAQTRNFELAEPATLDQVVQELGIKADRVAVELNGTIVPRQAWPQTLVNSSDRMEVVHFVGGGTSDGYTSCGRGVLASNHGHHTEYVLSDVEY